MEAVSFEFVTTTRYLRSAQSRNVFFIPILVPTKGKKAQFKEHKVFNSYFTLNLILLRD